MTKKSNVLIINLIIFIHIFLIAFIIFTPLTRDDSLIRVNIFLMLFLLYSWAIDFVNNMDENKESHFGRCGLTQLECQLRGIKYENGFIYKIIKPFNLITDKTCSIIIICAMIYWIYFNYNLIKK